MDTRGFDDQSTSTSSEVKKGDESITPLILSRSGSSPGFAATVTWPVSPDHSIPGLNPVGAGVDRFFKSSILAMLRLQTFG